MKFGRNIAPFFVSAVVMLAVCGPVSDATPLDGGVTGGGSVSFSARAAFSDAGSPIVASHTVVPQDRKTFRYAVSLYDCGMYERAAELFAALAGVGVVAWDNGAVGAGDSFDAHIKGLGAKEIDFDGAIDIEALGYYVLCAVKMQTRGYTVLANSYILKYPYGSLVPQIRFAHAVICFDMGDYKGTDSQLEPMSRRKLYHRQVPEFLFMKALSRLELGEDDAKSLFMDVINYKKSNRYALPAHYFLGYILYEEGNLAEARDHFAIAVADPRFRELAEGYLIKCGGTVSQSAGSTGGMAGAKTGAASTGGIGASAAGATVGAATSTGAASGTEAVSSAVSAGRTAVETTGTSDKTANTEAATETTEATTETATEAATEITEAATEAVTTSTAPATTPLPPSAENDAAGEAAYNRILASYDKGEFEEVEDLVLDFAESDDPNQYWLAKSFIILGDSYAEQGEFAKALATFESVRDGYNPSEPDDAKDDLDVRIRKAEGMLNKKK